MSEFANYATFDYGAHWTKLVYSQPFLITDQLASYQGSYYAFGVTGIPGGIEQLWVSHNQLHSWAPIALPNNAAPGVLWVNPASGAMLLETSAQGTSIPILLQSTDSGASWQTLAQANAPIAWIVQTPLSDGPWHICRLDDSAQLAVSLSADSGKTWTQRALPWSPTVTPKGAPSIDAPSPFAIAADGTLLAQDPFGTQHLYRLPASSTVWQDLGALPTAGTPPTARSATYIPTSSGGIFWTDDGTQTAVYPPQ
jgi:photosystem II stability/assembly factor-like uncharacterized protein